MTPDAAARIDRMTALSPRAVDLARLVSFAVLVEPALLRAVRLELLPQADAGVEADLWFGPLVQSRNQDGIVMFPAVAELLRSGLSEARARRSWRITSALHDHLAPAVSLEEKLNWLSMKPQENAQEIRELLQSAVTALLSEGRSDMANWAGRALPRLPETVRNSEPASMLAAATDLRLGRFWTLNEHLGDNRIPDWFFELLPEKLGKVELGVTATALGITFDPSPATGSDRIQVPASDPRVVQLSSGNGSQLVFVDAKSPRSVPLSYDGPIELTTLAGEAFTLERDPAIASTASGAGVVCAAYANCNQAHIVWQASRPIEGCLGFALERIDPDTASTVVLQSLVGFSSRVLRASRPTTEWPVQRFRWTDRPAHRGGRFSYQITPVVGAPGNLELMSSNSVRTNAVAIRASEQRPIAAYFNRELGAAAMLREVGTQAPSAARELLGGEIRRNFLSLLTDARTSGGSVYAALWVVDDPELIDALAVLGSRLHLIVPDRPVPGIIGYAKVRETFSSASNVYRRRSPRMAHNSFMVVCDAKAQPTMVWTGSSNWTSSGLYGQDSNALIIRDSTVAKNYLDQWRVLSSDPTLSALKKANARPRLVQFDDRSRATLWSAPVAGGADLVDVRRRLQASRSGVLFAIGPRSKGSVVNDILALEGQRYVAGVARTSHAGNKVTIHRNGTEAIAMPENPPKALPKLLGREIRSMPPIGSRLIVIDPFDEHPVVITGSHFLSDSASKTNDEDLVIVEGDADLAMQCAVHIQGLIDHYSFRAVLFRPLRGTSKKAAPPATLRSRDDWQLRFFEGDDARELRFWIGASRFRGQTPAPPLESSDPTPPLEKPPNKHARRKNKSSGKRSLRPPPKAQMSKPMVGTRKSTSRHADGYDRGSSKSSRRKRTSAKRSEASLSRMRRHRKKK